MFGVWLFFFLGGFLRVAVVFDVDAREVGIRFDGIKKLSRVDKNSIVGLKSVFVFKG